VGYSVKRRAFLATTALAAAPATVQGAIDYVILAEYTLDRGATCGFDLKTAVREAASVGPPDCVAITACYRNGNRIQLDWRKLTRPTMSREQARAELIEIAKSNLETYDDQNLRHMLMWDSNEHAADRWRRWMSDGPPDEEVESYRQRNNIEYLPDAEMDAIERGGFKAAEYR
jgi:hypothetical protein